MRNYNFSAGPSGLPTEVLEEVQAELLNWQGMGVSVMEVSHRSPQFIALYEQLLVELRELLAIPSDYEIILSSGGPTAHFAFLPLNLLGSCDHADYIVTGAWSEKAYVESCRYGKMRLATSGQGSLYRTIPAVTEWDLSPTAAYCHYASNETIHGVQFKEFPLTPSPLVVDMSSDILSKPIDVSRCGVIYAGSQKNIGAAGLTLVIIHRDLLGKAHPLTPSVFNYQLQARSQSMVNTPPTFNWYLTLKIVQHLKALGGLSVMQALNSRKAKLLYDAIDQSTLFTNHVAPEYRSDITIPFFLTNEALTQAFLSKAADQRLLALKGHILTGGIRACLYNAVPFAAVEALVACMKEFEQENS